jgi:hypothetical protein
MTAQTTASDIWSLGCKRKERRERKIKAEKRCILLLMFIFCSNYYRAVDW